MRNYAFTLLDICLPDYFQGYNGAVLAVPVTADTTKEELIDSIWVEYNSFECESLPDLSDKEIEKMCEKFILTDRPFNGAIEKATENTVDSVYMYFTIIEK